MSREREAEINNNGQEPLRSIVTVMDLRSIFLFLFLGLSVSDGYRILAIFPFDGKSHFGVLNSVVKDLASGGHQVDVMSNFPPKESFPNLTHIVTLPVAGAQSRIDYNLIFYPEKEANWLHDKKRRMCDFLGLPKVAELIRNPPTNPPYDLLLVHVLTGYQCLAAIGYKWNIPVVGVVTTTLYAQMHHIIGNPLNLALTTSHFGFYKKKLDFWDRVHNVVQTYRVISKFYGYAKDQDYYIKKHLGNDMPSYRQLEKNMALMFTNSHYTYHGVTPKTPGLIEIGGINIKNDTSELPADLKKFLDKSKDGFIYFSFGSLVVIETLPHEALERFYSAIRKISPVKVLMRVPHPDDMPKNMPDNVYKFSWLPQQTVFQHPEIKGFVTHGGAVSTQEAVYYGVPMICVPFFAEQFINCDILSHKNSSLTLDIYRNQRLTQDDYDHAFREIITNPTYKESVRKFSRVYRDRPLSPKETLLYWTEYVIRHGKNILKSPAVNLEWYQSDLLDVHAFLFTLMTKTSKKSSKKIN
ncbi:hypothetical protein TSAR_000187 [Trichomalopsis sarcophagae]|uniref:UDP-glycosyltransferases domain-containing protein n=1 Tax=Trichomalopsis sarcophagae TaxID=543379 RepID=A0A232EWH2_9HYME|nr:hypothetical protein TSAR_000187 [Trichomalopsis sarcophagae]